MSKIPCDDTLRHQALAKITGDYEAHEVGRATSCYARCCDEGNSSAARIFESELRMFVDTPLRWREAVSAARGTLTSPRAKVFLRTKKRLRREFSKLERDKMRKLLDELGISNESWNRQ